MNKRTPVSAAELYVLLDREFRARQSPRCATCYILLPYRVDRGTPDAPNWEVVYPPSCDNGCADILDEIVTKHAALYDLEGENDR
jgi:hypothetical protein